MLIGFLKHSLGSGDREQKGEQKECVEANNCFSALKLRFSLFIHLLGKKLFLYKGKVFISLRKKKKKENRKQKTISIA